ncbi:MAG: prepilin-type N-terminal cleavage/methylation domain-containing protein [Rickettsiales bacterium]|jgi:prepilin-type N-terminal cleavage/methylation domain-containing protein
MIKKSSKKAFSIIELSIVVVIISVLIGTVLTANRIVENAKLSTAHSLTKSSPVNDIDGLVAWFETTMPNSFSRFGDNDAALLTENGQAIPTWFDLSPEKNNAIQTLPANQPIYSTNVINDLPTLRFDNNQYFLVNGSKNLDQLSIFVVMRYNSMSADFDTIMSTQGEWIDGGNAVLGSVHIILSNSSNGNMNYAIQYDNNALNGMINDNISVLDNRFHLMSFMDDNVNDKQIYIDGGNLEEAATISMQKLLTNYTIGAWYHSSVNIERHLDGDIAEIIIFERYLNNNERRDVEQYLSKKWGLELS